MGRKKKEVVTNEPEVATMPPEVKAKKEPYSLYAWFGVIDKEGFKVKKEYKSEGDTVKELLDGVDFPKGVNRLVNVTLKHGDKTCEKALAPHRARAILEYKNEIEFENAFRGV